MSHSQLSYPEYINNDFLRQIIENGLLHSQQVKIKEFSVDPLACGSGENYCSDIYEVDIRYSDSPGNASSDKVENLILKILQMQKLTTLKQMDIFNRERYFYEKVVPTIETLMTKVGKDWILGPRFWYATSNPIETLAMENLRPQGFKLKSRQNGLDMAHSIMTLEKLAQYHALTFAMSDDNDQLSAIKDRFAFGLVNKVSCKSKSFQALFKAQLESLVEILQEDVEFVDVSKKLQAYSDRFEEKVESCVNPLLGHLNVLNHGDVWVNNLLFRHDSDEAVPVELRFIDFQLCFYGSLGYDVNYFLNTSVQLAALRDHRQTMIDAYVKSFLDTLTHVPSSKQQPTAQQIVQEIHSKEPYGFFVAFAFLPLMCMNNQDSQDNSLDNLNDPIFAKRKIAIMFGSNSRALSTLKYTLKRLNSMEVL